MMTEAYVSDDELMEYYGEIDEITGIGSISQMPVNFGPVSNLSNPEDITPTKVSFQMGKKRLSAKLNSFSKGQGPFRDIFEQMPEA